MQKRTKKLLLLGGALAVTWRVACAQADRADRVLRALQQDEKLRLVLGYFGANGPPEARPESAGYIPGIARQKIPPQWETDAGIGVASQNHGGTVRERTALPSGLATAATWNPGLAYQAGAMIGAEARLSGFNVMLAGGVNLARDPRNGRNFEYAGEDPLLAGTIVGAEIAGIQSNHIIATLKHFALNDQETGRTVLDAQIAEKPFRESDLLAFEIALQRGNPGAVMCAYNRVNGTYACENDFLLNQVLKQDWHFPGYVMSDWGAVHSVQAAAAGLDQESAAAAFDTIPYFAAPLKEALRDGSIPRARLDDMAGRIIKTLFAKGVIDHPVSETPIDFAAHAIITEKDAADSIVLLKNAQSILPLSKNLKSVAIIGSHADVGVLSGGGSSQVYPQGGSLVPGLGPHDFPGPEIYDPSSPLRAIAARLPNAALRFAGGDNLSQAAALAAQSEIAIVFAHQWAAESQDVSLTLPDAQDALIAAVAHANPRTIVVLETGGPVLMPWLGHTQAVLQAWYPGTRGGNAIAKILFGEQDASGRLPITFPASAEQLPRPRLDGDPAHPLAPFTVVYSEGAAIGYKWFARTGQTPLFPFGFGLSYGQASYAHFAARLQGGTPTVSFDVHNESPREIHDLPQIYAASAAWDVPIRLVAWRALDLAPGATAHVDLPIDKLLLASWDSGTHSWQIAAGSLTLRLATSAQQEVSQTNLSLSAARLPP